MAKPSLRSLARRILPERIRKILSGTNGRTNRPPRHLGSREYAERFGADWYPAYPKTPVDWPEPVCLSRERVDLQARLDPEFPEMGVLRLANARIDCPSGRIFGRNGIFLRDSSWFGHHVEEVQQWPGREGPSRRLEGLTLSLASEFVPGSYGHCLMDSLARLHLVEKAGLTLDQPNHILLHEPPARTIDTFLDRLAIPREKCIWIENGKSERIACDELLATTFPGTRRNYPAWSVRYLRERLLPDPPPPSRRLYVSRHGFRRNVANESELLEILGRHGFEVLDLSGESYPPAAFASASIIVGPHGGALTDLAFCHPGTPVLELVPSDHVYPYFYTAANAAGLTYHYMLGPSEHQRPANHWGPSPHPFQIDAKEFTAALEHLIRLERAGGRETVA